MTPNLIRIVAAACFAAALLPAQEVREVIVRETAGKAKSSSKATKTLSSNKLTAIIEKLSDDELSASEREKLKNALMKMLGDVSGSVGVAVVTEEEPSGIRWHVAPGKASKGHEQAEHGEKHEHGTAPVAIQFWPTKAKAKDGDGPAVRWLKTSKQGQGKAKHAKSGDLATRAKQLRARLQKADRAGDLTYVFDEESGSEGARLMEAQKAYEKAKRAYAEAKKEHDKAAKAGAKIGADADRIEGRVRYLLDRDGKQGPKQGSAKRRKAVRYLVDDGKLELEADIIEYLPGGSGEDVRVFLRSKDGLDKAVTSDSYTFEWTTDAGVEVVQGKAKTKPTSKGDSFTLEAAPKGTWRLGKAKKGGKEAKGSVVIDALVGSDEDGRFKFLKKSDKKGDGDLWVFDSKDGKSSGARVVHAPIMEKGALLKLLHSNGGKGVEYHDVLLKLLGTDAPHAHDFEVIVEENEEREEQMEEQAGDVEVLEMIEEMRVEMRELRSMMQEIRNRLRSKRAGSNSPRGVRTGRLLPPPVRKEDAVQVLVRSRETR